MSTPTTGLGRLAAILTTESDEPVIHTPAQPGVSVETVAVVADVWQGEQIITLSFTSLTELLATQGYSPQEPTVVELLHGSALLPFQIPAERMPDFMQAVFIINRLLPVCSYGLDVEQGVCYLQCGLLTSPPDLPPEIAIDAVGHAVTAIQQYAPYLVAIAAGSTTLAQFRAHLKSRHILPPPLPIVTQEMPLP
ncbi:hypothetical protein GCM10023213_46920 [Prosthecobacter algae]|uniref:Sensory transduction regulator n=1 Tax=Prosthecobacter algae TaxID=1144682 RepID=A0ABP9PN59_9BACT